jgi:ribosomal protein S18 acetylase RimI-like enzyme
MSAPQQLRRIGPLVGDSIGDIVESHVAFGTGWHRDIDAAVAAHPELILRDGRNFVTAIPQGNTRIIYGFENERAFADRFPAMLDRLLPLVRKAYGTDSVRLRWSYGPGRTVAEPVLRRLLFEPVRDWIEFTLARPAKLPAAPAVKGIRFRDGAAGDAREMARLDAQAFPDTPIPVEAFEERLSEESSVVAMAGKVIAGFITFSQPDPGRGYVAVLAVSDAYRGRGIGAALTLRALRALFADGARSVVLTTDQDNGDAIRLYARLGFRQTSAGRDFRRLTDPKAIAKLKRAGEGTLIRFGGWR